MATVLAPLPNALQPLRLPVETVTSPITTLRNALATELQQNDSLFSDDDSLSDSSTDGSSSSVASPTATTSSTPSSKPLRRKRTRMSPEERKVRHREVQRQFMKRKRARIAELRNVQARVETQLRLVTLLDEAKQLQHEMASLQRQFDVCERGETPPLKYESFGDLVFSVPPQDEAATDLFISDLEWNEIFDVLSDDTSADVDGDSDAASQC